MNEWMNEVYFCLSYTTYKLVKIVQKFSKLQCFCNWCASQKAQKAQGISQILELGFWQIFWYWREHWINTSTLIKKFSLYVQRNSFYELFKIWTIFDELVYFRFVSGMMIPDVIFLNLITCYYNISNSFVSKYLMLAEKFLELIPIQQLLSSNHSNDWRVFQAGTQVEYFQ